MRVIIVLGQDNGSFFDSITNATIASTRKYAPDHHQHTSTTPTTVPAPTTTTNGPLTDAELTKLAETRPITVLFVGDLSFSSISKEQFMIYAQSQLNVMNAAFANVNIKLKMKVHDTYVMTADQDRTHLPKIPGQSLPIVKATKTMDLLRTKVAEYPGGNESDMVFVLTRSFLLNDNNKVASNYFHDRTGVCGGRFKAMLFKDGPFSYLAAGTMWSVILRRMAKPDGCKMEERYRCYNQLIPTYKEDLNASLCYTTSNTAKAPTFSGVVGFDMNKFCKETAGGILVQAGTDFKVDEHCITSCGVTGMTIETCFLGPCGATHVSGQGQGCFDEDKMLCFDQTCGKKYSEVKALSRRNWHLPDSYYDEDAACAKHP
ncbi:uncharacterized protein LOC135372930 isoform X1 [Ornithodoros turicata]|uniref:uncharacterized protein LOC135372930 isoform X1 n=1 Tax=Ornithodoros turicata TaxID=34597 RepID=UPI0031398946